MKKLNVSGARQSLHGHWSSRLAFIMAASGAAIGLGNIWKFPYITGKHGGGAFVLIYLACVLLIGIPIMMAELVIGRRGLRNPMRSMALLAEESKRAQAWRWLGALCIISSVCILSYYLVVAGWAFDYVFLAARGLFLGATPTHINHLFSALTSHPWQLIFWQTLMALCSIWVVARGVEKGLEKAVYVMFPGMLILLFLLVMYAMNSGYFLHGLTFLFHPNFSKLSAHAALVAMGHAFFTLSIACGSMMIYGAYLPKRVSIASVSVYIAILDTAIALLSGLAIFPLVFLHKLTPSAGPGLIFKTLPLAFGHMHFGRLFATLFFMMLVLAAFTSAISLLEPSVAWLMETYNVKRVRASIVCGIFIWLLGLGTVFSFNLAAHIKLFDKTFFAVIDYITANIFLPLSGLMIAVFVAWVMKKEWVADELNMTHRGLFTLWYYILRVVAPLAIFIVFLFSLGIIH